MAKTIIYIAAFLLILFNGKAQSYCYCDTTAIVNYVDTSYFHNDIIVEYRIDRETGSKYMIKTFFSPDTFKVFYQIDDSLLSNGETCAWYKNGKLKYRLLYNNDTLVGTNNFGWYDSGAIQFHAINKSDTIKTIFFNPEGGWSYEEIEFGGSLQIRKLYCSNGNVREYKNFSKDTVLVLEYYCSSVLKSIGYYWHSIQVGKYLEFYEDGSLKEKGTYINGRNISAPKKKRKTYKKGEYFESIEIPQY